MGKPAGGRPKAEDIWEHVTVLPGEKQVKCKYCEFKFAASANRIKSHIHRIEGKGVRICPKSDKIMRDLQVRKDLPDSKGSLMVVDKPRDYNKLNETMLDCYMSPKTMWEGIKALQPRDYNILNETMLDCYMSPKTMWKGIQALQQVQANTETKHHERIKVGPFYISNIVNEHDLQLMQYVFEHSSDRCKLFSSSRSFLGQSELTTLRPQTHLDSLVIDIFADILTHIEKRKESKPFNWYLPETFSRAAINSDSFVNFVEKQKMRENYMFGHLKYCEKIFIPIHVEKNSHEHYYLYIIHMKNQEVEIWDSLCPSFLDETERHEKTQKLLCAMENLFGKVIKFTKFDSKMATNILLQPNGYDCGIFVINYMQQSDNYVRQNPLFKFDSDKERLDLALKLLKNDLNGEKEKIYDKARRSYAKVQNEEALDLCNSKPKRLQTWKTLFGDDVGREAYMEFDDSDNRDDKKKNVGLQTEPAVALVDTVEAVPLHRPLCYRFHPTDEEIITWYLRKKVLNSSSFSVPIIGEADLNKYEPWDLPQIAIMGETEWYFFCHIDRKYPTVMRGTYRATEAGYWKAMGKDREIYTRNKLVGMKKALVFYRGRAPNGEITGWFMHEFRLEGKSATYWEAKNEWVVCKIFLKKTDVKKTPTVRELLPISPPSDHLLDFSPSRLLLMDPSFSNADHQPGYNGGDVSTVGNQHPLLNDDDLYQAAAMMVEQDLWNFSPSRLLPMDPSFSNADHQPGYNGGEESTVGNQHPLLNDDDLYQATAMMVEQDLWNFSP